MSRIGSIKFLMNMELEEALRDSCKTNSELIKDLKNYRKVYSEFSKNIKQDKAQLQRDLNKTSKDKEILTKQAYQLIEEVKRLNSEINSRLEEPLLRNKKNSISESSFAKSNWQKIENDVKSKLINFLQSNEESITLDINNKKKKKERESMDEVTFLEYKRNFEAKMKVPTTPHKKELKNRSLALIEYI
ncbi:8776_t:CDS:2 [Entrophospora sp. SA101]|nr:8776_t:CDS:2 [Entrophospora sp. SA101]